TIGQTPIKEMPGSGHFNDEFVFTRTIRVGASHEKLFMNVAEVKDGQTSHTDASFGYIIQGKLRDSVTAVGITGIDAKALVVDNRYLVVEVPPADGEREFTISIWKGATANKAAFNGKTASYREVMPDYENGSKSRWKEVVFTQGKLRPDTAAYVLDRLTL